MDSYLVPRGYGQAELVEKRSRFIGQVWRVETEEEARARIEEVRRRYHDARHHCFCYVLREGGVLRYGDDGEPQGTAGQPMLNVFLKEEVTNAVCVVTRYFGGVLLGAGGLTRIYNRLFEQKPSLNKKEKALLIKNSKGELDNAHFYGFLLIMRRMLSPNEFRKLKDSIIMLTKKYPFVRMDYYGFRGDWQQML